MLHFLYLQEWNPAKEVLSVLHMSNVCIREIEGIKEEERNSIGGCLTAVSSFIKAHPHFPSDNQTLLSNSVKLIHHSLQKNLFSHSRVEENGFDSKERESSFPPLLCQLCFVPLERQCCSYTRFQTSNESVLYLISSLSSVYNSFQF